MEYNNIPEICEEFTVYVWRYDADLRDNVPTIYLQSGQSFEITSDDMGIIFEMVLPTRPWNDDYTELLPMPDITFNNHIANFKLVKGTDISIADEVSKLTLSKIYELGEGDYIDLENQKSYIGGVESDINEPNTYTAYKNSTEQIIGNNGILPTITQTYYLRLED